MKKALIITLLFIGGFGLTGCFDDFEPSPTLWFSRATMYFDDSALGYSFMLDSGDKLIPTNSLDISQFEDSSRVEITYTIESYTQNGDTKTYTGDINTIAGIFTKHIIQLTEEIKDSIGNDPIIMFENSVWLTEHHLNVYFHYKGQSKLHYINLCKPIGEQTDDKGNQILEFRHNANDDQLNYEWNGMIAFHMDSLYSPGLDSINFVLQAVDGDTINYEYYGTYHFTKINQTAAEFNIPEQEFNILVE